MDRGNWLPPGHDEGRPNEMVYVGAMGDGWEMDAVIPEKEEQMYRLIEKAMPASFAPVDALRTVGPFGSYYVLADNDFCEVVLSREEGYFALAFVGKERPGGGWYTSWRRTSRKVFKQLFKNGYEVRVRTGEYSDVVWTPTTNETYIKSLQKRYKETGKLELATEMM